MPSAKTLAQNPGGNFNPVSSFGHAVPADSGLEIDFIWRAATDRITESAATATATQTRSLKTNECIIISPQFRRGQLNATDFPEDDIPPGQMELRLSFADTARTPDAQVCFSECTS